MASVLYISYDGLTDPLGQSQILPYLQLLTKEGYSFTILSFEKPGRFEKEKAIVQNICNASGITWVPLSFTAKPPVLAKIYDRYRMQEMALKLHRQKNFALVHCRSYIAAEIGLNLKKKSGIKMIFDMRGFWADEKVDNGQWSLKNPFFKRIYRHYKKREKEFLLNADGIVSLTLAAKDFLLKQLIYKHLSITVIPTCADLEHFDYQKIDPAAPEVLRLKLGFTNNDKILTYLGSIGGWYLTKEMFQFFKLLKLKDPAYKMLVLTKDDAAKVIAEAAEQGISKSDLVVTYSSRQELPLFLSLSTASIFFIRNTFSKMASSPTKHAELMGMGIPVICNDIGDTGNIIRETGSGLLVDIKDQQNWNNLLEQVQHLEQTNKETIRQVARDKFDLKKGAATYAALYKNCLAN